jgi:His-Xaa-Ser system radical SAM maturase HxsC
MLVLGGTGIEMQNIQVEGDRTVARLTKDPDRPAPLRKREGLLLIKRAAAPEGFRFYVALKSDQEALAQLPGGAPAVLLPDDYDYLDEGDVIRVEPKSRRVRVLYRRRSPNNYFLVTERCNSLCLMCSQPPRNVQDDWIVDEISETIPLIDPATPEIDFTGGEPTLLGDRFFSLLRLAKGYLPNTAIHILSNGRTFSDPDVAARYAAVDHPDMMVGIPLYSDLSHVHDYVVQADGAFGETIRGILNLKRLNQRVEVRVVVHRQTYKRLPQLAEFIARNLTFVDHVTFMGLEMTGFTRANLDKLWIDPYDYQSELRRAVLDLAARRMHVSIYNHQLCTLDRALWPFARKSISDWKNEYMAECDGCAVRQQCGGFFASAQLRYSDHISSIRVATL